MKRGTTTTPKLTQTWPSPAGTRQHRLCAFLLIKWPKVKIQPKKLLCRGPGTAPLSEASPGWQQEPMGLCLGSAERNTLLACSSLSAPSRQLTGIHQNSLNLHGEKRGAERGGSPPAGAGTVLLEGCKVNPSPSASPQEEQAPGGDAATAPALTQAGHRTPPSACTSSPQAAPKALEGVEVFHNQASCFPQLATPQFWCSQDSPCPSQPWHKKVEPTALRRRYGLHLPQRKTQTNGLSPANTRHKDRRFMGSAGSGAPLPGLEVLGAPAAIRGRAVLIWRYLYPCCSDLAMALISEPRLCVIKLISLGGQGSL